MLFKSRARIEAEEATARAVYDKKLNEAKEAFDVVLEKLEADIAATIAELKENNSAYSIIKIPDWGSDSDVAPGYYVHRFSCYKRGGWTQETYGTSVYLDMCYAAIDNLKNVNVYDVIVHEYNKIGPCHKTRKDAEKWLKIIANPLETHYYDDTGCYVDSL